MTEKLQQPRAASTTMSPPPGEFSPLLLSQLSDDDDNNLDEAGSSTSRSSQATSFAGTIVVLIKGCMGTGCLALAYACQQGGIVFFTVGLLVIAAWNFYAMQRLCLCLNYIPNQNEDEAVKSSPVPRRGILEDESGIIAPDKEMRMNRGPPPAGTTTLGVVAWYSFGEGGLLVLDVMLMVFFFGILVAYIAAFVDFVRDTPFTLGPFLDATVAGGIMLFLSLVPDFGYLSRVSALGLFVLVASFVVIAVYGISNKAQPHDDSKESINFWPVSLIGLSHWFGIVVIGFGVVPLTYNIRDAMAEPYRMVEATAIALGGVAVLYIIMGVGLYLLFPSVQGEVLHELGYGFVPTLTRLAMGVVVLMTTPLLIVPCGELLEGKFGIPANSSTIYSKRARDFIRFFLVASAVGVSVLVPNFVQVLSFVGCTCVGLLELVSPAILHMRMVYLSAHSDRIGLLMKSPLLLDGVMLVCGIFATIASTLYSLGKL